MSEFNLLPTSGGKNGLEGTPPGDGAGAPTEVKIEQGDVAALMMLGSLVPQQPPPPPFPPSVVVKDVPDGQEEGQDHGESATQGEGE